MEGEELVKGGMVGGWLIGCWRGKGWFEVGNRRGGLGFVVWCGRAVEKVERGCFQWEEKGCSWRKRIVVIL